jgi:hypothetical protein
MIALYHTKLHLSRHIVENPKKSKKIWTFSEKYATIEEHPFRCTVFYETGETV